MGSVAAGSVVVDASGLGEVESGPVLPGSAGGGALPSLLGVCGEPVVVLGSDALGCSLAGVDDSVPGVALAESVGGGGSSPAARATTPVGSSMPRISIRLASMAVLVRRPLRAAETNSMAMGPLITWLDAQSS